MQNDAVFKAVEGTLTVCDLTALTSAQLASAAHDNIAYRYALRNLIPFAVVGNDSVYEQHNKGGELNLFNPANGDGDLTDQYIADRAMMLRAMNQANTGDETITVGGAKADWAQQSGDDIFYQDKTEVRNIPTTIYQGNNTTGSELLGYRAEAGIADMWQIRFGSSKADSIPPGGNTGNHLYGGAGNDNLTVVGYPIICTGKREAANDAEGRMRA